VNSPITEQADETNNLTYSENFSEMKRDFDQIKEILSAICGDVEFLMS